MLKNWFEKVRDWVAGIVDGPEEDDSILRKPGAKDREGLTLVDMSLAMGVAAVMMMMTLTTVASAQGMRVEADRMAIAVALAQTKLAQLLSNPELSTTDTKGRFGRNKGVYSGYGYRIIIREEKIDLAKIQQTGTLGPGINLDDKLPPTTNQTDRQSQAKTTTQTGGQFDVIHIIVKISYPRGGKDRGEYSVETYRAARKKI